MNEHGLRTALISATEFPDETTALGNNLPVTSWENYGNGTQWRCTWILDYLTEAVRYQMFYGNYYVIINR